MITVKSLFGNGPNRLTCYLIMFAMWQIQHKKLIFVFYFVTFQYNLTTRVWNIGVEIIDVSSAIQVFLQHSSTMYSVSENWNYSHAFIKVPSLPPYLPPYAQMTNCGISCHKVLTIIQNRLFIS